MKKFLSMTGIALACASTAFADGGAAEPESARGVRTDYDVRRVTPVQIGLADPLTIPGTRFDVRGLRWSIFYGSSRSIAGLDISLAGLVRENMDGLSLGGFNWVQGLVRGAQLGVLGTYDGYDAYGLMLAGGFNITRSDFLGAQLSPVNVGVNVGGVQLGAVNWNTGVSGGLQVGAVNVNSSSFTGADLALVNCAGTFTGFQCGLLNIATKEACGVQFGIFNAADRFRGVQIGLLNLIGNSPLLVMPIANANF